MKARHFTLIELLVVVTIILIVLGLLIPAASTVLRRANINKTRTAVRTLQIAIAQYEATYGVLPFTKTFTTDKRFVNIGLDTDYDNLLKTLAAQDLTFNPKGIKFLEVNKDDQFLDAWDNNLTVALDLDHSGALDNAVIYGFGKLSTNVAIWSKGPDELESATDSHADNSDNINSWD